MNRKSLHVLASTEESVKHLIELCRKDGPVYAQNPKEVAHINRTSKWLLNAIGKLNGAINDRSVRP